MLNRFFRACGGLDFLYLNSDLAYLNSEPLQLKFQVLYYTLYKSDSPFLAIFEKCSDLISDITD